VAAPASRHLAAAEGLPTRQIALTAAASQIGNPCLPSFHGLLTLCTIILLRWNEGGVAYSRVDAYAEGRRGMKTLGSSCLAVAALAGRRARDPRDYLDNSVIRITNGCDGDSIAAVLYYTDPGEGGKETGQFVESVHLTCNGQST